MPRSLASLLAFPLVALAALGLVACGEDDAQLLPGGTAREITANLDTVQQLSDEGDCVGAESAAQQVGEQIEALEGVDRKLKVALEDGAARLEEVIVECEESTTESIAPAEIPPEDEEEDEEAEEKEKKPKPEKGEEKPDTPATSPALPPQANGEGKGLENEEGTPPGDEEAPEEGGPESPSGGVSPGSPAGGGK
ncbi:MAG: hypothetical protein ABW196_04990 [Solirubrobacterales bacterium]